VTKFSQSAYEILIYSLPENDPGVASSTLRLYSTNQTSGTLRGQVYFKNGLTLHVFEMLDLSDGEIFEYSYTIYRDEQKIRWYDPQPHPDDPTLQSTFPHHYHTEPDIKHNRQPAEGISFTAPNLPVLIAICCQME
jgi:hypothetical protein